MRGEDKYDFDMAKVADLVNAAGVFAYVEHTGGGTATIYAGEEVDYETSPGETWKVFKVAAGPGTFAIQPDPVNATLYDFSVGPNDQGEAGYITPADVGALTMEDIAKIIVAQAGKPFPELLTREEVTALGFDGTGKSKPADMVWEDERSHVGTEAYNVVVRAMHAAGTFDRDTAIEQGEEARAVAVEEWELTHPHPDPMVAAKMVEEGRLASGYGPIVKVTGPNSLSSPGQAEPKQWRVSGFYPYPVEADDAMAAVERATEKTGWEWEAVPDVPDDTLPEPARHVIDECIAEAWRNTEQNDATTAADVAADVAQRLYFIYRVRATDDDYTKEGE